MFHELTRCPFCQTERQIPQTPCNSCGGVIPGKDGLPLLHDINVNITAPIPSRSKGDTVLERLDKPSVSPDVDWSPPGAFAKPAEDRRTLVANVNRGAAQEKIGAILFTYEINPIGDIYHLVRGKNLLGSGKSAGVCIPEPHISRVHAVITYRESCYYIADNNSTNGTFLNNSQVTRPQPVTDGDMLRLGLTNFLFRELKMPSGD